MKLYLHIMVIVFSMVLAALGGVLIFIDGTEIQDTIGAVLVGAAMSFVASAVIQIFTYTEQTRLLTQLTLSAEGIQDLPDEFRRLKWIAYATSAPDRGAERRVWRVSDLNKRTDNGKKFAVYKVPTKNLIGEESQYNCTFIGLTGSVLAIVSLGGETTSTFTFDTAVSSAGMYFGPGYITDWFGKRELTLAIVGLGTSPNPDHWSVNLKDSFKDWHEDVEWDTMALAKKVLDDDRYDFPDIC